jgi:hypothetical protein
MTKTVIKKMNFTFIGARDHLMLSVGMLQNALGAEHLLVRATKELYLLVFVDLAISDGRFFRLTISTGRAMGSHRQGCKYSVVYR